MTYDKAEAERIHELPDSELGEGGPFLDFDVPGDLQYGDNDVVEAGYDGRAIYVEYEGEHLFSGWSYFRFSTELRDDGTITVTDYPAGVMSAEAVFETDPDAPHAGNLRPLYEALQDVGVVFGDLE